MTVRESDSTTPCIEGGTSGVVPYRRLVGRRAENRWCVRCSCGFVVYDLTAEEAAVDTRRWHMGLTSLLGASEQPATVDHREVSERRGRALTKEKRRAREWEAAYRELWRQVRWGQRQQVIPVPEPPWQVKARIERAEA